jgi:hypothetical protein
MPNENPTDVASCLRGQHVLIGGVCASCGDQLPPPKPAPEPARKPVEVAEDPRPAGWRRREPPQGA